MKMTTQCWLGLLLFAALALPLSVLADPTPIGRNVQVTDAGLNGEDAAKSDLAIVGNTLYAVWEDNRDEANYDVNSGIYFARSEDGGQSWSQNVRVYDPAVDAWAFDPAIAVQPDGTIWIVWHQLYTAESTVTNDLRLARSTDGGATWERRVAVDGIDGNEDLWRPDLAADADNVYLLHRYYDCQDPCDGNTPEGFTIALDRINPSTFAATSTVVSDTPYRGRFTSELLDDGPAVNLVLRDGLLCAAWEDQRERFSLYGACSTDQGATFGANFRFSGSDAVTPILSPGPDGVLYASYSLSTDARRNVILRRSTNQGQSWSEPLQITSVAEDEILYWDLVVDPNGQLVFTFAHGTEGSWLAKSDLFLVTSQDEGRTFVGIQVEDDQGDYPTVSSQDDPSLVVSGAGSNVRAHLIWDDDRNTGAQIWGANVALDGVTMTYSVYLPAVTAR